MTSPNPQSILVIALALIQFFKEKTLLPPDHLSYEMKDAWKAGASKAFNNAADVAEAALGNYNALLEAQDD